MKKLSTHNAGGDRHRAITASLEMYGVTTPASEAEGIICGLIIAGHGELPDDTDDAGDDHYQWLAMITGSAAASRDADERVVETIRDLRAQLLSALRSDEFDVQILLPSLEESIDARFEAITCWCQGFLFGFLHDRDVDIDSLPNDAPEIINDIMAIAESDGVSAPVADGEAQNTEDDDEHALMEIEQYLRIGVQLLFEELTAQGLLGTRKVDRSSLH